MQYKLERFGMNNKFSVGSFMGSEYIDKVEFDIIHPVTHEKCDERIYIVYYANGELCVYYRNGFRETWIPLTEEKQTSKEEE